MADNCIGKITQVKITGKVGANNAERKYRKFPDAEYMAFAKNTSFAEIAELVVPDREGKWKNKLLLFECRHQPKIGINNLVRLTVEYLKEVRKRSEIDILSVSAGVEGNELSLIGLIRYYDNTPPNLGNLYEFLGEFQIGKKKESGFTSAISTTQVPRDEEEIKAHSEALARQMSELEDTTDQEPFLNRLDKYTPIELSDPAGELVYDLLTRDSQLSIRSSYEDFIRIFQQCMQFITSVERDFYYDVIRERQSKESFFNVVESHVRKTYVHSQLMPIEDWPALKAKLDRALFELYIVQDLIDDPDITDIKITAPDSIRVRIHGKAYLCNVHFIDRDDYNRFIKSIAVKNNIDLKVPTQTFTDDSDPGYLLRFSITAPYITGSGVPIIHIRKVARKKLLGGELIAAEMMDEKIRDYLLDCGKYSRGVVFAGPPGSGKTVALNWFLEEAYESEAEILVIQESDELFCYRKGVMFEHVVNNPQKGEMACSLEDLGKMALVAGANVFVIGEAKGAEICSAITLSNSGCRTAITIHSPSAKETVDKMADLAMRGYATSYEQAKRMIKSFQTIVYLKDFKVQEISEIIGYDEERKDMIYRMIYKRPDIKEK